MGYSTRTTRGLEDFKQWIVEDHKAFSDMQLIIEDDFAEEHKVAIRWTLNLTHGKEFSDIPGVDIFHFEKVKKINVESLEFGGYNERSFALQFPVW